MGLFDLFSGKKKAGGAEDKKPKASSAAKWADRAGDKRAQNYDRQEAIAALAEMGTSEAVTALLKRFTFNIDPSITDQEEKETAFNGILKAGNEAIEPVRAFSAKAESLAWPLRIIKSLLDEPEYVEELLRWLSRWDTEYSKFIDAKLQLLVALEEHRHPSIRATVEPFVDDVNETARYHAAVTLLAQEDADVLPALLRMLPQEESFRVKNKVLDGIASRGWPIAEADREAARKALPPGYSVDASGRVQKRETISF